MKDVFETRKLSTLNLPLVRYYIHDQSLTSENVFNKLVNVS